MPLSEREQRILEEIEKTLYKEDPAFAEDVERGGSRHDRRTARLGAALTVAGFITLILFFITSAVLVGVIAFGAMVAGIVLVVGSLRSRFSDDATRVGINERFGSLARSWEERLRDRYRKR